MRRALLGLLAAGTALALVAGTIWLVVTLSDSEDESSESASTAEVQFEDPSSTPSATDDEEDDDSHQEGRDQDPMENREQWEDLAIEAAEIMTTWTPAEDFNQTAAELRATDLMTQERAEQIMEPERPTTGTEWLNAAEEEATSDPTAEINAATGNEVVSVLVTWEWVSAEGATVGEGQQRRIFYFSFEEDPNNEGEFLISDYSWDTPR